MREALAACGFPGGATHASTLRGFKQRYLKETGAIQKKSQRYTESTEWQADQLKTTLISLFHTEPAAGWTFLGKNPAAGSPKSAAFSYLLYGRFLKAEHLELKNRSLTDDPGSPGSA